MVKNSPAKAGDSEDVDLIPGSVSSPGEGNGNPLQYSCLENSRQRSLAGYSPWGHKELDTTEWLTHTHIQLAYQYYSFKKYSLLHHLKNNALRDAETDRWKFTSLSPNRYLLVYWIQQSSSLFLCLQNSGSSLFCHKCATQLLYPSLWQFKSLHKHLWSALSRPGTVQGAGWRIHSPYSQEEGKRPLSKLIKAEPWNWLVPKDQGFILDSCRVLCLGHRKGVAHSAGMCEYSPW